jgi:hypothetical protein
LQQRLAHPIPLFSVLICQGEADFCELHNVLQNHITKHSGMQGRIMENNWSHRPRALPGAQKEKAG